MKMQAAFAKLLPVLLHCNSGSALQHLRPSPPAKADFQRTLQFTGAVDLDLSTGSGDIRVSSGASGKVEISARIKANSWFGSADEKIRQIESNPPIQQSGNTIRVGHLDSDMLRNISISYEIIVPAETRLHSHTGSGDQTITGLQGPVEVDGGSGDLKLSSLGAGVHAETGSGDVDHPRHSWRYARQDRQRIDSRFWYRWRIRRPYRKRIGGTRTDYPRSSPRLTGSGDVELRGIQGSLQAETGQRLARGGRQTLRRMEPAHKFRRGQAQGSGSIQLRSRCLNQLRFGFGFHAHDGPGPNRAKTSSR